MRKEIYTRAEQVIAWLGKEESTEEYEYLQIVLQQPSVAESQTSGLGKPGKPQPHHISDAASSQLNSVFQRSYFERLWVVQEVLLAQEIIVCCGHSLRVSWDALRLLHHHGNKNNYDWDIDFSRQGPARRQESGRVLAEFPHTGGNYDLKEVLKFARNSCDDVRDKVYGLQGLVKPEQQITIDYNKTCAEIIVDVAIMLSNSGERASLALLLVDLARSMELTAGLQLRGFLLYLEESKALTLSGSSQSRDTIATTLVGLWNGDIVKQVSAANNSHSYPHDCEVCSLAFRSEDDQKWHLDVLHPQDPPKCEKVLVDTKAPKKKPPSLSRAIHGWLAGSEVKLKRLMRRQNAVS